MISYQDAMDRINTIQKQITEHADASERASQTYTATMMLYNVACSAADKKAMSLHRDTLHTVLDVLLDSGAMIADLQKQIKELPHQIDPNTMPYNFR